MSATAFQRRRREIEKAKQSQEEQEVKQIKRAPKKVKENVDTDNG